MATRINKKNLDEKQFTNKEVLTMLNELALKLDTSGYYRYLDLVEELTGDRNFEV